MVSVNFIIKGGNKHYLPPDQAKKGNYPRTVEEWRAEQARKRKAKRQAREQEARKRRAKAGVKALREIRKLQNSTELLIPTTCARDCPGCQQQHRGRPFQSRCAGSPSSSCRRLPYQAVWRFTVARDPRKASNIDATRYAACPPHQRWYRLLLISTRCHQFFPFSLFSLSLTNKRDNRVIFYFELFY